MRAAPSSTSRVLKESRYTRELPMETGSYLTASTTIQSSRTAETVVDRKEAVSAEIFRLFSTFPVSADKNGLSGGFWASGLCIQKFRSRRQGFREPALGNRLLRCELRAASKPIADSIRARPATPSNARDRKSTRLNSSHQIISYAVFCLKKKRFAIEIRHRSLTTFPIQPTPWTTTLFD